MELKSKTDFEHFFRNSPLDIYGVGLTAYNRAYFSNKTFPNYKIVCLKRTKDMGTIKKDIQVLCVEEIDPEYVKEAKQTGTAILENPKIQAGISEGSNTKLILPYKGRENLEKLCKENNWLYAMADFNLAEKTLEDKIKFRSILKNDRYFPEYIVSEINNINYSSIKEKLGEQIVVQIPFSSGGKGTFKIKTENEFNKTLEHIKKINESSEEDKRQNTLLISKYVKGIPASVACVATRWGTFVSSTQIQIQDIPEITGEMPSSGTFIGHDWSLSRNISDSLNNEIIKFAKEFGDEIYKLGFKGFFGIDILLDPQMERFYAIECNPRITGAQPVLDMIQESYSKLSFMLIHVLEFLPEEFIKDIALNSDFINSELNIKKDGAHLLIFSKYLEDKRFDIKLSPGIYSLQDNELKYLREGYKSSQLKSKDEFIITELIEKDNSVKEYGRIARIVLNDIALEGDFTLNNRIAAIISLFWNKTEIL